MTDATKAVLQWLFAKHDGYVRILLKDRSRKPNTVEEKFYAYPLELEELLEDIDRQSIRKDVYFTPHLYSEKNSKKKFVTIVPCLWSDLDECHPDNMIVAPSLSLETSPGRFHAFWKLDDYVEPEDAEAVCKRIAYHHLEQGADKGGWDLSQLLRLPGTYNHKYGTPVEVQIHKVNTSIAYDLDDFKEYPAAPDEGATSNTDEMPDLPDATAEELLDKYKVDISPTAFKLWRTLPQKDWSSKLWQLNCSLLESGLTPEEAFVVAWDSKCNKYKRDGRPKIALWKEISKAYRHVQSKEEDQAAHLVLPSKALTELLSDEERKEASSADDLVSQYINWAKSLGDAAPQYHQAGAFILLSSILSGKVTLPTSFGNFIPNMWFMILADTTLTRKTTAMDIAMDMIIDIDPDAVLATDGSIEGLMASLAVRPKRPSIFLRDEVTGLIDAVGKKEYLSGMLETLTKLYDGKYQKRILKKETIEVRDPILIFFAGGIKTRMQELLLPSHVTSGFLPRFIVITAEVDMTKIKPLGPPTEDTQDRRDELLNKFRAVSEHYEIKESSADGNRVKLAREWRAKMTPDAWARYNSFEHQMTQDAMDSAMPDLMTPTMNRLANSGLKVALLLAASSRLEDKIEIQESDLVRAFYFVEQWRNHTLHLINNIGLNADERLIERVYTMIKVGNGVKRSDIMRAQRMTSKDADIVFNTLEQRGLVARRNRGSKQIFFAAAG